MDRNKMKTMYSRKMLKKDLIKNKTDISNFLNREKTVKNPDLDFSHVTIHEDTPSDFLQEAMKKYVSDMADMVYSGIRKNSRRGYTPRTVPNNFCKAYANPGAYERSNYYKKISFGAYIDIIEKKGNDLEKKLIRERVNKDNKKSYFEVEAINYSSLAAMDIGPQFYISRQEDGEEKEHYLLGSCVDCLLTEPDLFDTKYLVEEEEEFTNFPTPQMKKYVEKYIELGDSGKAFDAVGFKKANILSVMEKYNTEGKDYADYLMRKKARIESNKDKKIISKELYNKAKSITNSLLTNRFTKSLLTADVPKNIEVYNQFEIYWTMLSNNFKCKVDKIIIDHDKKEIQPIDIKTTGKHVNKFKESFFGFRYDIQASLYYQGISDYFWSKNIEKYGNYTILPFKFVVESTKYIGSPLIFRIPNQMIDLSYEGFSYEGKFYNGWRKLYEDLLWHKENNIWDYSKNDIENNGEVEIVV